MYRCAKCQKCFKTIWQTKNHYQKHLHPKQKKLVCPFVECNWFGSTTKDYAVHRKSSHHQDMAKLRPDVREDVAKLNKNYQEPSGSIAIPCETALSDHESEEAVEVTKVPAENGHIQTTVPDPTTKAKKTIRCPSAPVKKLLPKALTKKPIVLPSNPVHAAVNSSENKENKLPSPSESPVPGPSYRQITRLFGSPGTPLTPLMDEEPIKLPEKRSLSEEIVVAAADFEERHFPSHPLQSLNKKAMVSREIQTAKEQEIEESSSRATKEAEINIIEREFMHMRKDASFHAVQLRESLKEITDQVTGLRSDVQKMETQNRRSDFQDRLEIAGHGAKLLDILGSRHPHGQGFQESCSICQKGNDMLVTLVSQTDPRLMNPFHPSFL